MIKKELSTVWITVNREKNVDSNAQVSFVQMMKLRAVLTLFRFRWFILWGIRQESYKSGIPKNFTKHFFRYVFLFVLKYELLDI